MVLEYCQLYGCHVRVKEGGYNGSLLVAATIADKGARGAAIDAYKRGMILESKM